MNKDLKRANMIVDFCIQEQALGIHNPFTEEDKQWAKKILSSYVKANEGMWNNE